MAGFKGIEKFFRFTDEMKYELDKNDDKLHWLECDENFLKSRLTANSVKAMTSGNKEERLKSLVDTANFCMMLWDRYKRE